MPVHTKATDWRSIAEQASTETDSGKLKILVAELCGALDTEPRRMNYPLGLVEGAAK